MQIRRVTGALLTVLLALASAGPAAAEMRERSARVAGATVRYKVVLPSGYDGTTPYPAVLVFGGGPQTMNTVERTLDNNFRAEAEKRGFIVVAPAASGGGLFFEEGARIFPEFLRLILAEYQIRDGRFHVAGPSNGGIAAMHVAAAHPQYFLSATAFPGFLWQPTEAKLAALAKTCVFLYVGEYDDYRWHGEMKRQVEFLRAQGALARYVEERDQPHRIETLAGAGARRLFDGFEEAARGCGR